jgi:copper oxidase (laccase) domain-containing protein
MPDTRSAGHAGGSGTVLRPDPGHNGRWLFDLWQAAAVQLAAGGVREANIHLAGLDTGPGTPFFSHRSEAPTGRFALVARLKERP